MPPERHPDADRTDAGRDHADGDNKTDSGRGGAGEVPDIFPTQYRSAEDAADVAALAQAERAAARHAATPEQIDGVAAAGQARRAEDRLEGWQRRQRH